MLVLTANPYYRLDGVQPGTRLTAATRRRLRLPAPFHVGRNLWYLVPGERADGVLKVQRGVIQEVGLASSVVLHGRAAQRRFFTSFKGFTP